MFKVISFNNMINGMYSFVPCKKYNKNTIGFERVKLTNNELESAASCEVFKVIRSPENDFGLGFIAAKRSILEVSKLAVVVYDQDL